ncbi:MAG: hypothetical protein QNJ46_13670, partial [Leptolyngbyaceae cyanobacterium MO_188.B28]|nr:hypothetical protein [Leptolyngbyaceae cyanobacterium MO_188.B28]
DLSQLIPETLADDFQVSQDRIEALEGQLEALTTEAEANQQTLANVSKELHTLSDRISTLSTSPAAPVEPDASALSGASE